MARVKKKSYENLAAQNIEKVIALLNPSSSQQGTEATQKAITKKEACEILNISYNTTRLNAIIEGHLEQKAYVKKRKSQNRGRPASDAEISEAVTDYLSGANVTDISKRLFRSVGFVRAILEGVGVPQRPTGEERKAIDYFPDECVSEDFAEGEIAWSAIYHSAVKIGKRMTTEYQESKPGLAVVDYESKYASPCYQIYVIQKVDSEDTFFSSVTQGGFSAYSTAYDLGKLEHLKKYGVDLNRL
jgi:hypothetical protein